MADSARLPDFTSDSRGRPKLYVDREKLEFFRSLHFSWEEISAILGISSKTLQRRAREWNIQAFSTLSDSELDGIVGQYMLRFPNCGEAMLRGHLHSNSLHIQR